MKLKPSLKGKKLNIETVNTLINALKQEDLTYDLSHVDENECLSLLKDTAQAVSEIKSEKPTSLRSAERAINPVINQAEKLVESLQKLKSTRDATLGYMEGTCELDQTEEESYVDDVIGQIHDLTCRARNMLTPQDDHKINLEKRKRKQYFKLFHQLFLTITEDESFTLTKRINYQGTEYYGAFYCLCELLVDLFELDIKPRGIQEYADDQINDVKQYRDAIKAL